MLSKFSSMQLNVVNEWKPAGSNTKPQPPSTQNVEARGLLGDERGLPL